MEARKAVPIEAQRVEDQGLDARVGPDRVLELVTDQEQRPRDRHQDVEDVAAQQTEDQAEPEPPPEVEAVEPETAEQATEEAAERVEDISATRPYRWIIRGIENLPEAEEIRAGFDERSALESDEDEAANAAQIDRRARADAELLAELLRSQGYYDAVVEPSIEVAGTDLTVQFAATPGPLYRFESVELPGLEEAAGNEAATLREAFAVKAGDPLSHAEMSALVDRLFATDLPHGDPHGRATFVRLELAELHRRFGRT